MNQPCLQNQNRDFLPGSQGTVSDLENLPAFAPEFYLNAAEKVRQEIQERAWRLTRGQFGRKVFVRGVVEPSNYCRENCSYCGMRRDNRSLDRYRADFDQLAELLLHHRPSSLTDLNIQTGEDPVAVRKVVLPLVRLLRRETSLGISVCLGTLSPSLYAELKAAGATMYIIKFETGDPEEYRRLQAPGTLVERLEAIHGLKQTGWRVSSGFIMGLPGQSFDHWKANFQLARSLPLDGCSVSPFIPGESTPLASEKPGDLHLVLHSMALLRVMRPQWIIPAVSALNLAEPRLGYRKGFRAGANLATINLTPPEQRGRYLLYSKHRFIMTEEGILSAIAAEGLEPSTKSLEAHFGSDQKTSGNQV